MKKSVMIIIFLILILFPIISAQANQTQLNNGFACLSSQVGDCSAASIGEQIFTSLADGKCVSNIVGSESTAGCWPTNSCDIKTTAQAVLALHNAGQSTSTSQAWLATQILKTPNLNWYMQINTNSNSQCTITYTGTPYTITLNADKSISANGNGAGSCLSIASNWLLVSPSCYGTQFQISCNQSFTQTNLYQRQNYPTIYVSSSSHSAPSGGKVFDTINSSCFGSGNTCNFEASLWASIALDSIGVDISPFLPYLTVMATDSTTQQYLPYSFLYALTNSSDYLNTLLAQQKTVDNQNYWDAGSNYGAYYDTALALLPLQSQNPSEKQNAVDWLMSNQGSDGCWNSDSIPDTAFILFSLGFKHPATGNHRL